ncbi:hypothetical protein BD289DRAFT_457968 [Coniella lustricola]|uniref:RING-type domain-containing protein n=1 Tax=Coniella lustricola TaxID=2025994 RepID=A0A2T3ALU8_9PEZI|nr:hypothetical protein BD289DRAFT_457968 [Coniella lustricola]
MRPPRIAILVLFSAASLFLFCRSIVSLRATQQAASLNNHRVRSSPFRSFLSFTAPFTLFPPNAAISLTDDNSTFFPARPAAFGPPLPAKGLSGQLWIGSGFADDALSDVDGEGELGCSDLPGWGDGATVFGLKGANIKTNAAPAADKAKHTKRSKLPQGPPVDAAEDMVAKIPDKKEPLNDGTDDYLHRALSGKASAYEMATVTSTHADIQSIQETAEITGKVVLLSRGGCGFLEKVKWAQRRGAIGVIVGDNQRGGPLIQMFARGDTSNVTIPAIFTSRTTAHLLSSLMQPGSFSETLVDENGSPAFKIQQPDKTRKNKKTVVQKQDTAKSNDKSSAVQSKTARKEPLADTTQTSTKQPGWLARMFGFDRDDKTTTDRSRPPSSGQHDWVLVDDWSDERDKVIRNSLEKASKSSKSTTTSGQKTSGDGFQIGVQDWRDPDLVETSSTRTEKGSRNEKDAGTLGQSHSKGTVGDSVKTSKKSNGAKDTNGPKGGSITPGSGQYVPQSSKGKSNSATDNLRSGSGGLMPNFFGDDDYDDSSLSNTASKAANTPLTKQADQTDPIHEGLWVTITPTGSTAPFFDTLLVLVVSPLITLTVVYALLILRAKIRRRRWRAPKSVVERLPVRTYHTVATTPSHSSRVPSPTSSSPTTPLLQSSSRPRPRSRTTTGVPDADDLLRVDTALQSARSPSKGEEKPSEWKKYMGRQVECVVCLEEYVDGVSRVMSLPCGHEFHVDCITPWLTTRRRTCPICKGDVVRSLARGSPSSPRYDAYHDDDEDDDDVDDDIEPEASGSSRRSLNQDADVEQGTLPPAARPSASRASRSEGWLSLLSSSVGGNNSASPPRGRVPEEDRDR